MEVRYLGWESFKIREKGVTVVTNPFSSQETGVVFPKTKAEIVLVTGERREEGRITDGKRKEPFWITGPGEYEINEVEIWGFPGGYWWRMGEVGLVYWETVDPKIIKELTEQIRPVDVVFVEASQRQKTKLIVEKFSPGFLIPFVKEGVEKEKMRSLSWGKEILDIFDQEGNKPVATLRFKREEIPEETQVVILEPKGIK